LVEHIPLALTWTHEIRHDGYRIIARRDGTTVNLWTRNGHDYADHFTGIASALGRLPSSTKALNGEAVILPRDGQSDFGVLRSRSAAAKAVLVVFDVLMLEERDVRPLPIEERRPLVGSLLVGNASGHLVQSEVFAEPGDVVFRHVCAAGLEGLVCKRLGSRYRSGPSDDWLKVRCPAYEAILAERFENWNG
jgi:bifunctional non-homologous end joining protein LigD